MSSRLFTSGAILLIFHLDTPNDRPTCAGGIVVQKTPVRTSAQVMARFRRWFRCPPLCQWAGWNTRNFLCQLLGALEDVVTLFKQDSTINVGHPTADFWQGLRPDGRLPSGGGTRNRETWTVFIDPLGTLCGMGFCTTPSWRSLHLRSIQKLRSNQARR